MLTVNEFTTLWNTYFSPICANPMPSYKEYLEAEGMIEDYLDIFRGTNTRESRGKVTMPDPHPFFNGNKPKLPEKPNIKYVMIGEARPFSQAPDKNFCGGDKANSYFYNVNHIKPTPWLNAPRLNWGCPPFQPCPNNKVQTLLCLASKGVLLLDLFPFAVSFSPNVRKRLNKRGFTRSFWDETTNPFNLQDRIRRINNLLSDDWDLTMVAPCVISEHIVNPTNLFPTLITPTTGLHPITFRMILPDNTRCNGRNCGNEWKKLPLLNKGHQQSF